ncbi:AMIN-like domain-containing (lipo)protein [Geodermatophilus maliterrae]|uniref:AMIN-like domain-containing protein n=1 Tax=Geodermatophilus maliterrae TaxID=3162531 RepID=A0ABV3XKR6_9ACTN
MLEDPVVPARTCAAVVLAATAAAVSVAAAPATAAPSCGVVWGSTAETAAGSAGGTLDDVRTGRHACYDRLVLDLGAVDAGDVGHDVRYVPVVRQDGSGTAVPLRGSADLQVVVHAPAHDAAGRATYDPADDAEAADVSGYSTFRQVAWANSFEGRSTVGLGVRARLPFRVVVLDGPGDGSRLVVDVAHTW